MILSRKVLFFKGLTFKNLIVLFVASTLFACDKQTVYHSFQSLPVEGWSKQDTLNFTVPVIDSTTIYNVSIEVRNRNNYPYQNLPILICYDTPETKNIPMDTVRLALVDKDGIFLGEGWGGLYQSASQVGHIRIGKAGEYKFKITYLFPDKVLSGINDVGIKLQR